MAGDRGGFCSNTWLEKPVRLRHPQRTEHPSGVPATGDPRQSAALDDVRPAVYGPYRMLRWTFPCVDCPRCGTTSRRVWDVTRVAIDIDLDQPVVLSFQVSVHVCGTCSRMFRAQPPFLRPRGIYTRRVVEKAIEAVYRDGLAARRVPDRLARDFWVKPSEKMVRLCSCAFAAEVDFSADCQPWVVANFSGILCFDEVYQGELAMPAAQQAPARLAPYPDAVGGTSSAARPASSAESRRPRPSSSPTRRVGSSFRSSTAPAMRPRQLVWNVESCQPTTEAGRRQERLQ